MIILFLFFITMGIAIDVAMHIRNKPKATPQRLPWLSPTHPDYELQLLMGKEQYWKEIEFEL